MNYRKAYLVGCEGIGMSALAQILIHQGTLVLGSDLNPGEYSKYLQGIGAIIYRGHNADNITPDIEIMIISAAIPESNPEVQAAHRHKIPVVKYAEMLGKISQTKKTVAIAGTHGKSTTSGMVGHMLCEAKFDPTFVIGAKVRQIGSNARVGNGKHFVVEACEYDRSFLNLSPSVEIITNIEPDHLDYYKDITEIVQAFDEFAQKLPQDGLLVIEKTASKYMSNKVKAQIQTYSINQAADWNVTEIIKKENYYQFHVTYKNKDYGDFSIILAGIHNVSNALAVIAVGHHLGLTKDIIQHSLREYNGVGRRFEIMAQTPITVIDDYAHHPTKIRAVLSAVVDRCKYSRMFCIFQPHQASRTYHLFDGFCQAFDPAFEVIVTDIFYARDSLEYRQKVSSQQLAEGIRKYGKKAQYLGTFPEVRNYLESIWQPGDLVITIGAGSITQLGQELAQVVKNGNLFSKQKNVS